ncbi:hypothetical protein AAVH_19477 [Aphelenchoides avenae]|nr:hypothetical protein AAVH_19477 [Aphelenchus avenae]
MYFNDGIVYYTVKPLFQKTLHQRFVTSVAYFFSLYLTVFTIAIPNYVMGNRAFALLVAFEVLTSALAALALYGFWWPSVQHTAALTTSMNFTCTDDGRIPHFTFEDAV